LPEVVLDIILASNEFDGKFGVVIFLHPGKIVKITRKKITIKYLYIFFEYKACLLTYFN
jgi:hypothetical protein